jgi:hypothetical protein
MMLREIETERADLTMHAKKYRNRQGHSTYRDAFNHGIFITDFARLNS